MFSIKLFWGSIICLSYAYFLTVPDPVYAYKRYAYTKTCITSWVCLLISGLKLMFHWKAHLLIFLRSSFSYLADTFTSWMWARFCFEYNQEQEQDSVLSIIEKYKFNPSIKLLKSKNKGLSSSFSFKFTIISEVKKSINNLDRKKTSQKEDICTSILKTNPERVWYIYQCIKRRLSYLKKTIDPLAFFQTSQKYMKGVFMINC